MMCEYWHHMEVYEVQFGIYISSYEVYRTGKPCNIGRICTPMVYIPANTAEPPCPLQVIQRIILYPKLHFIIFSYMMSAFALLIFYLSSAMPWTVSHRFLPAPSGIPSAARSLSLSRKSFVVSGSSDWGTGWRILQDDVWLEANVVSFVYRLVRTQYVYVSRRCTMLTMSDSRHTSLHIPHPVPRSLYSKYSWYTSKKLLVVTVS